MDEKDAASAEKTVTESTEPAPPLSDDDLNKIAGGKAVEPEHLPAVQ